MIHLLDKVLRFELFPQGTLGRIFINTALNVINRLRPGVIEYNDYLIIKYVDEFIDAIKTIRKDIVEESRGNPFPRTGNDNRIISRKIMRFNRADPSSAINYLLTLLEKKNYEQLKETITAPSIMRIEFYEFSKKGYTSYGGYREHPYRKASIMDLALAILGSYIMYTVKLENKILYYFIPHRDYMDLKMINSLKNELRNAINNYAARGGELEIISSYKLVRRVMRENTIINPIIGDIVTIIISGNRFLFGGLHEITTSEWSFILERISSETAEKLDILVRVTDILSMREKKMPITYNVIRYLYKYAMGSDDSLYYVIRELGNIAENLQRIAEGKSSGEEWRRIYRVFREIGIKEPHVLLRILASELSRLAVEKTDIKVYEEF